MPGISMPGGRGRSGLAVTSVNGGYTLSAWESRENPKETMTAGVQSHEWNEWKF